jgi:hypothetical protein
MSNFKASVIASFAVIAIATPAFADGMYWSEQVGGAKVKDELSAFMGDGASVRLAFGMRRGQWAGELWGGFAIGDSQQTDRQHADCNFDCGVSTSIGHASPVGLAQIGVDAKYIAPLTSNLEGYARGGLTKGYANLDSANYEGRGLSGGVGIQLKGKVSVWGLLWAPLFLTGWGPKITGAVYADTGIDFYRLQSPGRPTVDAQINTIRIGFALGSDF